MHFRKFKSVTIMCFIVSFNTEADSCEWLNITNDQMSLPCCLRTDRQNTFINPFWRPYRKIDKEHSVLAISTVQVYLIGLQSSECDKSVFNDTYGLQLYTHISCN